MRFKQEDMIKIVAMLSSKTGYWWSSDDDGVHCSVIIDAKDRFEAEKMFLAILEENRIPMPTLESSLRDAEPGKARVSAKFQVTSVLLALLRDSNIPADYIGQMKALIEEQNARIASMLCGKTGYKWLSDVDGVNCCIPINAPDRFKAEEIFLAHLKKNDLPAPVVESSLRGAEEGTALVSANYNLTSVLLGLLNNQNLIAVEPYVLKDAQGDNYVTSVTIHKGAYIIIKGTNNKGEPRSITIHRNGKVTDENGSEKLGYVCRQMLEHKKSIFEYFNIDETKILSFKCGYIIKGYNDKGELEAMDIRQDGVTTHKGAYIIKGSDNKGEQHSITLHRDGKVTDEKGSEKLGYLCQQMFEQRRRIIEHFIGKDEAMALSGSFKGLRFSPVVASTEEQSGASMSCNK